MAGTKKHVQVFHYKEPEAKPLIAFLEKSGYGVGYGGLQPGAGLKSMRENGSVAAVIDLTRMPSYGRYLAAEIRSRKSLQQVPIVFVDGDFERVQRVRAALPDALFTPRDGLAEVLQHLKPVTDPVLPPRMMASDRTVAQKMGIKAGMRVAVFDPPAGYAKLIGTLPEGASFEEEPEEALPLTLWFVRDEDVYLTGLRKMRRLAAQSKIWIVYPKQQPKRKQKPGINQNLIRESALAVGLVDYKICSVDAVWSGMLFTLKK